VKIVAGLVPACDARKKPTADWGLFRSRLLGFGVQFRRVFAVRFSQVHHSYSLPIWRVLFSTRPVKFKSGRDLIMEWTTPQHEEIDLNCEVSSYANAEL
jgi:hypothetical protein